MRRMPLALLFLVIVPQAYSQALSLPSVDGITAFYRMGRLSTSSAFQAERTTPCPHGPRVSMCGWGFETVHNLTTERSGEQWGAELAVGYDFLTLRATTRGSDAYEILGSVQTLPSITLYLSRDLKGKTAIYFGLGTGLVVLKNVRAYDANARIYSVSGDTWGLTPSVGLTTGLRTKDARGPGTAFFIEASYEVREFSSVAYILPSDVKTLPAGLPRTLSASGLVVNIGFEINFLKKAAVTATPAPTSH